MLLLSVNGVERAGIKLFIKICASVISYAVKAAIYLFEKTIFRQNRHTLTCVLPNWTAEMVDRGWGKIPMIPDQLQDLIIRRSHPLGSLSHVVVLFHNYAHVLSGTQRKTTSIL